MNDSFLFFVCPLLTWEDIYKMFLVEKTAQKVWNLTEVISPPNWNGDHSIDCFDERQIVGNSNPTGVGVGNITVTVNTD